MKHARDFRVVALGGGVGASQVMTGLREYTRFQTGVIAVTDSGRSTGVVRSALNVPAPGDLRNALVTLSEADPVLKDLFQHRLAGTRLDQFNGVAFGNLFLAALAQMTGSFEHAVLEMNRILKPSANVLPVTLSNTHLCAELVDGSVRYEEVSVRGTEKPAIRRVYLRDDGVEAYAPVVEALRAADLITIGPGSLFTTVIACLIVPGIREAIAEARANGATTVYVCNTTTQPGQTDGFTLSDHVAEVVGYLGTGNLDYTLVNTGVPAAHIVDRHRREGLSLMTLSAAELRRINDLGVEVVATSLIETGSESRALWNKVDTVRHEPARVGAELASLMAVIAEARAAERSEVTAKGSLNPPEASASPGVATA